MSSKDSEVAAVSEGNARFSGSLHQVLRAQNPGNLVYSPFSIHSVCAMAKLGAAGCTDAEIVKHVGIPSGNNVVIKGYGKIMDLMKEKIEGCTIAAANNLYSQTGFDIKPTFIDALKSAFGIDVQLLDFSNGKESAHKINSWVAEITQGKINEIFSPESLDERTRIVLVNGVYFKGLWKTQFKPNRTRKSAFHLNATDTVDVDMMTTGGYFNYGSLRDLNLEVIELAYKGGMLSMLVYLPLTNSSLKELEETLAKKHPSEILAKMAKHCDTVLSLPRFKMEADLNLVPAFKKLGLTDMFDEAKADFSGIYKTGPPIYVSQIVQKAIIEVNEEGSEAAATTGMGQCCSMPSVRFRADRPFVFHIIDKRTNMILFAGTCLNPSV